MKIVIMGGAGFLGQALTRALLEKKYSVDVLTRRPNAARLPAGARPLGWDGVTLPAAHLTDCDALINLVGETIGAWPWNARRKQLILESRMHAAQAASRALQQAEKRPAVYIQASGIAYYGGASAQPVDESAAPGNDFLAQVAIEWEKASASVEELGVRRVLLRTGVVLDRHGSSLPLIALPVQFFAGGPIGNGAQGFSWIHLQDYLNAVLFLLENPSLSGAFNLSAPHATTNAAFMRALAGALKRPYWLPAPAFAMRLLLGEMSDLLLTGQCGIPQRLLDAGFTFQYPNAASALSNIYTP
jgi:uncharacterized protein